MEMIAASTAISVDLFRMQLWPSGVPPIALDSKSIVLMLLERKKSCTSR